MLNWLGRQLHAAFTAVRRRREIPDSLWQQTLAAYPFLMQRSASDSERLRSLTSGFLAKKEFQGAGGIVISDAIAVAIAAQACLPLVCIEAGLGHAATLRRSALDWYGDFVGIVVQPGEVIAPREQVDESGVVHHYEEIIAGEAMDGGPVMLSWPAVADAGASAVDGYNVVIHEFIHKIDMADGAPDGCPPLGPGFLGAQSAATARTTWLAIWEPSYQAFREKVIIAERFGGAQTWLDPYGAETLEEFFAVACEAYFVNPDRFAQEFAELLPPLNAFFGIEASGAPPDDGTRLQVPGR